MTVQRDVLALVGVCVLVAVLSIIGLASVFLTHLDLSLDGLLLILVSLMMAALFGLTAFSIAKDLGWLPRPQHAAPQTAESRPAPARPAEAVVAKSGETVPVRPGEGK
jgi:hypothetical protein